MFWALAYVLSIITANIGFSLLPVIYGIPPMTLLVGGIFVLRDLAQRQIGHYVLIAMAIGVAMSYGLADPFVATASAVAFALSEAIDWYIYTRLRRPLKDRILISSAISVPVDSFAFLLLAGFFTWQAAVLMILVKYVAAVVVWMMLRDDSLPRNADNPGSTDRESSR